MIRGENQKRVMEINGFATEGSAEPQYTTDVVVVGTGPAGGSIATFLGSQGELSTHKSCSSFRGA